MGDSGDTEYLFLNHLERINKDAKFKHYDHTTTHLKISEMGRSFSSCTHRFVMSVDALESSLEHQPAKTAVVVVSLRQMHYPTNCCWYPWRRSYFNLAEDARWEFYQPVGTGHSNNLQPCSAEPNTDDEDSSADESGHQLRPAHPTDAGASVRTGPDLKPGTAGLNVVASFATEPSTADPDAKPNPDTKPGTRGPDTKPGSWNLLASSRKKKPVTVHRANIEIPGLHPECARLLLTLDRQYSRATLAAAMKTWATGQGLTLPSVPSIVRYLAAVVSGDDGFGSGLTPFREKLNIFLSNFESAPAV